MSIEYLEIRNQNFEIAGICDVFTSLIWHRVYFGVGDFEIYAPCNAYNLALLIEDAFVTRPNESEIGIIEKIEYTYTPQDGRMIIASGRFAKSILDRRIIVNSLVANIPFPIVLNGNVEGAARFVIDKNAISCTWDTSRNFENLDLGERVGFPYEIVDENGEPTTQQVFLDNLLTWTDEFLKKYTLAATVVLNSENKLEYNIFQGVNRAVDNEDGNEPVIFSQDFDNLISSKYISDATNYKNFALIGGENTDARVYMTAGGTETGINRRETFIDGSNTTRKIDGSHTMTFEEYRETLAAAAVQRLNDLNVQTAFDGEINLNSLTFKYKSNYNLGDIITVQDADTKLYINSRIIELTEIQDSKGYQLTGKYETV